MTQINDTFEYQWSKTIGFFTNNKDDVIANHIDNNELWFVSEKLDGSNMAISSEGYIASRHKIIATRNAAQKFQGFSLENILPLFEGVTDLHNRLKTAFFLNFNFSLIVYGEFMPKGTANSKFDVYNYNDRGYEPGKHYAFGIGLVFDEINPKIDMTVQSVFKQAFLHTSVKNKKFYLVPIDWFLTDLFYNCNIECVRLHSIQKLQNVFARSDLMKPLLDRQVEGYILTNVYGNGMLKLKLAPAPSPIMDQHFEKLQEIHSPTHLALRKIYNSSADFLDILDKEIFTSYFNKVFEDERNFIENSIVKEMVCDEESLENQTRIQVDRFFNIIVQKLEDHYRKRLTPELKCEIKGKIAKKISIFTKYLYKSLSLP